VRVCRHPAITRRMVTSDASWPGLVLPLKRYHDDGRMETAYLQNPVASNAPVTIYYGNMWGPTENDKPERYPSVDELIIAGWEVD
jgi:hypothetical protein